MVAIADGDTITVLLAKTQHKIRPEGIDAPKSGQDFGSKAKHVLSDKIFGKDVKVVWKSRDKYKRILGEVYLDDRHINLEMVKEGYAWHYVEYSKDETLAKAEKEAREKKLGLWSMKAIPPWEFRRGARPENFETDPAKITVYVTKSGKKYHSEGCRFLAKGQIDKTLAEVGGKYEPCSVCKPPMLKK